LIGWHHSDLKSLNVLVRSTDPNDLECVKLIDFGDALELDPFEVSTSTSTQGTARWAAPELVTQTGFTSKADIFSLGIIMWELCTRTLPFHTMRFNYEVQEAVVAGERPEIPQDVNDCNARYAQVIESCWLDDPDMRPTAEQALVILEELQAAT
jgi:serine/threonine protein kinase